MSGVTTLVLTTVNAPYGAGLSARQLAAKIADPSSAATCDAAVFAFFSEVSPSMQAAFIEEMGVDKVSARDVASRFSLLADIPLPPAA